MKLTKINLEKIMTKNKKKNIKKERKKAKYCGLLLSFTVQCV
jgi:predicted N-acyltransferase